MFTVGEAKEGDSDLKSAMRREILRLRRRSTAVAALTGSTHDLSALAQPPDAGRPV